MPVGARCRNGAVVQLRSGERVSLLPKEGPCGPAVAHLYSSAVSAESYGCYLGIWAGGKGTLCRANGESRRAVL